MKIGSIVALKKPYPSDYHIMAEKLGSKIPVVNMEYVVSDMREDDYGDLCIAIDEIEVITLPWSEERLYWPAKDFNELLPPQNLAELLKETQQCTTV